MTRARSLSKLSNPATFTVDTDNNVGVNSTSPVEKLNVVGVVSATSFFGDGTGLTGVASTDNIITGTAATFNSVVKVGTGITLDATSGIVTATGVNVTGVVTATTFKGDGSQLTGISAGVDVGITTNISGTFNASAGTPATINTLTGYSANDLVVEYTIYIKNGSDFQSQKLLAMRDGTTIHSTQFAVMFSSSLLVQCDATINSGNILLRATPETGVSGSTTYKIKREVM